MVPNTRHVGAAIKRGFYIERRRHALRPDPFRQILAAIQAEKESERPPARRRPQRRRRT